MQKDLAVPYIQGATEPAVGLLSRYDISVAHNPVMTLRTILMRPKDPLEPREKSNVTHGFEFSQCLAEYVWETGKRLRTRMREHKGAIRGHDTTSKVLAHSFDNAKVINGDCSKGGQLFRAW